jgi:glycosyltransferase involved in cell wall biosynthesis
MRVLLLSKYMRNGASSRLRFYQYLPYLESQGVQVTVVPLLGKGYIEHLYSEKKIPLRLVFQGYFKRFFWLLSAASFDLIWIEKELFPWLPSWAEELLNRLKIPFIVDYDDAVFHPYDFNHNWFVRTFLGQKIDKVMQQASLVLVGNEYLGERARQAGAKRIELIPSVVNPEKWQPKTLGSTGFRIGWIGSPITAPYLSLIQKPLEKLCEDPGTVVVTIGAGKRDYLPGVRQENLSWSEETEANDVMSFDVGIMPLSEGPFEEGKCGYKLIQYMAAGLPVVASPVGVNKRIVQDGINGYLAADDEEWLSALVSLREDPGKRMELGKAGHNKFEENYSLEITAPKIFELLKSVVPDRTKSD